MTDQQQTYSGEIDPASMVISPQDKPPAAEPNELPMIGGPGDPRAPSQLGFDTPQYGTETPYRKTPPHNIGSKAEGAATSTPPTAAGTAQADALAVTAPSNTVAPAVTGTVTVGQTLTCAPGTFVPAASSYLYQWYRYPDTAIVGATANTRVLAAGDSGYRIYCRVTGKDANGVSGIPVNSNIVGPVP